MSAAELARLLPALHPIPECRKEFARVLGTASGAPALLRPPEPAVLAAAEVAWTCLPAHFTKRSFQKPFTPDALWDRERAFEARMPRLRFSSALGVCRGSPWSRTCSYWVSMHALAYRADALGLGQPLLRALINIIAGGATLCGGCTLHFRALTGRALSPTVRDDLGRLF